MVGMTSNACSSIKCWGKSDVESVTMPIFIISYHSSPSNSPRITEGEQLLPRLRGHPSDMLYEGMSSPPVSGGS